MASGAENKPKRDAEEKVEEPNEPVLKSAEQAVNDTISNDGGMYLQQNNKASDMNSLCKFNFIFYFIYKYKYQEEPGGNDYLDFEF